ncbi:MAG TPA: hypothetical protein VL481_00025 [Verrucomicrobiae bacterium]|nr:hypothetical protein [Verrucomicrobiae bacterium]
MNPLNDIGRRFAEALRTAAKQSDVAAADINNAQKVHVTGAGRTLTFAYEQLRNAAEYTEEHLLLQRAAGRFYRRVFFSRDSAVVSQTGEELITELTLAGYLQNDTVTTDMIDQINKLAGAYYAAHLEHKKDEWTLQVLAVEVERILNSDLKRDVFTQFAYEHFQTTIDRKKLFGKEPADFEVALFAGVHRALLKSDPATIRTALLHRYRQHPGSSAFVQTNKMIDGILESSTTDKIYHLVSRRGAALRVLWRLIDEHEDTVQLLSSQDQFLSAYEAQIQNEYSRINSRINKGIIKSVIFLIITKFLIGISIEVPYDYLVSGSIVMLPLIINLFFPPVYMVLLRFTLRLPGESNARTLTDIIDHLLYGNERSIESSYRTGKGFGLAFNIAYSIFFILIFGGVAFWLITLGFSLLHLFIFFVFLSTASFLGFRLSRQIRELEASESQQDGITIIRDFLYIPFVVVGRWMSEKYARVNIVAMMLDMVIELPLKTVLHLIRQWGAFIASKKDEL